MNLSESESFPALRHEIAGVPVRELARQFGTPVFIYDAAGDRQGGSTTCGPST